jgi:peptidoglycan/LPS O-acetylase OafA/YrhL
MPPAPRQKHKNSASLHLDAIRGAAALAVFFSHQRALFFVDYEQVVHKSLWIRLIYLLTGFGHEAVIVFFILSGYLIAGSVRNADAKGRWSGQRYALNRITRLYIVLIPALLLGAFWDRLGMHMFPQSGVYLGAHDYRLIVPVAMEHSATWSSWIGNLFYLQGILVRPFGSNGPLWSLSYEFWYYALFPLIWLACSSKRKPSVRLGCLIMASVIALFVGKIILLYFVIWLLGAALNFLPRREARPGAVMIAFILFMGMLLLSRLKILHEGFGTDLALGLSFMIALYTLLNAHSKALPRWYARAVLALSGVSYTMYLVHVPLLVFLNALIVGTGTRWQPGIRAIVMSLGVTLVTMAYIYLIWRAAEANTDKLRSYLERRS